VASLKSQPRESGQLVPFSKSLHHVNPHEQLCNKCGLFERTHSRPRPDQFPHKRGPLTSSVIKGNKSPPPPAPQLPPLSNYAPTSNTSSSGLARSLSPNPPSLPPIADQKSAQAQAEHRDLPAINTWLKSPRSSEVETKVDIENRGHDCPQIGMKTSVSPRSPQHSKPPSSSKKSVIDTKSPPRPSEQAVTA
jgi:hypothetical protein